MSCIQFDPFDVNGINKAAGEHYHLLYNQVYGIPACVLRLTNTYGPGMRVKDARQTFVGIWVRRILEGDSYEVWGGEQLRDFNFVDDVVDAFLMAAKSSAADGQIFNLGSDEVVSLNRLAEVLVGANNGAGTFKIKNFPAERKKIDIGDYYSDASLIENVLGWKPKVALDNGLKQTLVYYRQHLETYL